MIVAVVAVLVMQMRADEVVDVVAVRHSVVAAAFAVDVTGVVAGAAMIGRAAIGVLGVDGEPVLVHVVVMWMVEVSVVQVVDVVLVHDGGVTAAGLVPMGVVLVDLVLVHARSVRH